MSGARTDASHLVAERVLPSSPQSAVDRLFHYPTTLCEGNPYVKYEFILSWHFRQQHGKLFIPYDNIRLAEIRSSKLAWFRRRNMARRAIYRHINDALTRVRSESHISLPVPSVSF